MATKTNDLNWVRSEKKKAQKWVDNLSMSEVFNLGDELVLGEFDWRDWLDEKPSSVFLNEADRWRTFREETND